MKLRGEGGRWRAGAPRRSFLGDLRNADQSGLAPTSQRPTLRQAPSSRRIAVSAYRNSRPHYRADSPQ
jgi:hypothetical protein